MEIEEIDSSFESLTRYGINNSIIVPLHHFILDLISEGYGSPWGISVTGEEPSAAGVCVSLPRRVVLTVRINFVMLAQSSSNNCNYRRRDKFPSLDEEAKDAVKTYLTRR